MAHQGWHDCVGLSRLTSHVDNTQPFTVIEPLSECPMCPAAGLGPALTWIAPAQSGPASLRQSIAGPARGPVQLQQLQMSSPETGATS